VSGYKGLAGNPKYSPQGFAETMADGFKGACPETFAAKGSGKGFGETKFGD
jgi:hypothetical protein